MAEMKKSRRTRTKGKNTQVIGAPIMRKIRIAAQMRRRCRRMADHSLLLLLRGPLKV